jgi:hypothetical protein
MYLYYYWNRLFINITPGESKVQGFKFFHLYFFLMSLESFIDIPGGQMSWPLLHKIIWLLEKRYYLVSNLWYYRLLTYICCCCSACKSAARMIYLFCCPCLNKFVCRSNNCCTSLPRISLLLLHEKIILMVSAAWCMRMLLTVNQFWEEYKYMHFANAGLK